MRNFPRKFVVRFCISSKTHIEAPLIRMQSPSLPCHPGHGSGLLPPPVFPSPCSIFCLYTACKTKTVSYGNYTITIRTGRPIVKCILHKGTQFIIWNSRTEWRAPMCFRSCHPRRSVMSMISAIVVRGVQRKMSTVTIHTYDVSVCGRCPPWTLL